MVAGSLQFKQRKIEQLTHELAMLKRWRFAQRSAQLSAMQRSLLKKSIDEDPEAIGLELEELQSAPKPAPLNEGEAATGSTACRAAVR